MVDGLRDLERFDLSGAFLQRQQKLRADLGLGDVAKHPTTKGDDTELNWLRMLRDFLPRRYGVSTAFVVDSNGNQSRQMDIVIHDCHFSPLLFTVGHANFIPAESVYAALEVRQDLSKDDLDDAAEKILSVRRLHRTSVDIPHAGGVYRPVALKPIIGGLVTRRSAWHPPFGPAFEQCVTELACHGSDMSSRRIDIGCAVDHGSFSMTKRDGIWEVDHSKADAALISFVMRLLRRLQLVGSAPAVDYESYLKAVPGAEGHTDAHPTQE